MQLQFSRQFFFFLEKNTQMSSFIKIRPWVAEMFYGDGQKGKT